MKKQLLIMIGLFMSSVSFAQSTKERIELPQKDGSIYYEGVVVVDSTFKKDALYSKAREWFVNYYKSANAVLQMEDKSDGKLIGKGVHPYVFNNGLNIHKIDLYFTVNITVKDGKYKYMIYDFDGEDHIRDILNDPKSTTLDHINYSKEYASYIASDSRFKYRTKLLAGLKEQVEQIFASLEKTMKSKPENEF